MAQFKDKYGLYNVKPCCLGEPSGNDGAILTSYAQKLGLPVDLELIKKSYWDKLQGGAIPHERLPGKAHPPPSRDTILGWYWLGFLSVEVLQDHDWNFSPYALPKYNFFKTLAALWRVRSSHRNVLWQGSGEPHLWRLAFSVPFQDRAYMLKDSGMPVPFFYQLWEWINRRLIAKSTSSRLIHWRKYGSLPDVAAFLAFFGKEHDFLAIILRPQEG